MTFIAVLPSIYPLWTNRCVESMCDAFAKRLNVIDNTQENRGVAASWNIGIESMLLHEADWLVIVSAAMRFGSLGGADFLDELDRRTDALVVEAHHGIGWHLIAMSRKVLDEVGPFETRYFSYMEDVDWGYRFIRTYGQYGEPLWQKASVDVAIAGFAHGIDLAGARPDNVRNEQIYAEKFGGSKGHETFDTPYDDPALDWTFVGDRP